jgi:hypothetical protein
MTLTPPSPPPPPSGPSALPFVVVGMLVTTCLLCLVALLGRDLLPFLVVVGAVVSVGLLHYLLWGWTLSREVEPEREEERLRQQAAAEEWPLPESNRPRHF